MTTTTTAPAAATILTAYSHFGGCCRVEFTEDGCTVLSDDRKVKVGYLHVYEDSAEAITDACRDQMIRYFFGGDLRVVPSIGASAQHRYFAGLSVKDIERIGNGGGKGSYA